MSWPLIALIGVAVFAASLAILLRLIRHLSRQLDKAMSEADIRASLGYWEPRDWTRRNGTETKVHQ